MAKYGRKASEKVERAMRKRKRGTLRSGGSGRKVTSRKQAIAIGLSEAREAGAKVPRKSARRGGAAARDTSGGRKTSGRKTSGRNASGRKTAGRKSTGGGSARSGRKK